MMWDLTKRWKSAIVHHSTFASYELQMLTSNKLTNNGDFDAS